MTEPLPPDLSRLGDALARATERDAQARARRRDAARRLAATAAAAAMAVGVFLPGVLGGGDRSATI
ncbi:MAG: hypothetical protein QOC59_1935, partial [Microbacteriaceae bacterium]|nr:hypothetical protein [Microbacteriaceae bacterium]